MSARPAPMLMKAPPPPSFSWTGCYVGAGGGYGMWNQDTYVRDTVTNFTTPTQTGGGRGWFGTAQLGCDYQVSSSWVIGVFGDWDWSGIKGTTNLAFDNIADEKNSWTWAAGGRIGYVMMPQFLTFVSGGYTQAHFDAMTLRFDETGVASGNLTIDANTYHGWFLGTGYEYGLSILPGLFWKTEYRYSTFQAADLPHLFLGVPNGNVTNSTKFIQTVRSELVFRFNMH
jgi:outer membrane immunogenic protein